MKKYQIVSSLDETPPEYEGQSTNELFWWVKRTKDGECICTDRGEPEDKTFARDFRCLIDEMNTL